MTKWDSDAYKAGASAGLADNYSDFINPYDKGTVEWKEWLDGYSWGLANWDMNMNDGG